MVTGDPGDLGQLLVNQAFSVRMAMSTEHGLAMPQNLVTVEQIVLETKHSLTHAQTKNVTLYLPLVVKKHYMMVTQSLKM